MKSAYECLEKAIEAVKPGTRFRDIGDIISKHASANNVSVVRRYGAHDDILVLVTMLTLALLLF